MSFNTVKADNATTSYQLDNVVLDVYSQEIRFAAQPNLRFESIAMKKTELGTLPGKTIQFLKFDSLGGSAALTEGTSITPTHLSTSTESITVAEYGRAVQVTEFLLRSSTVDVLTQAATLLGMHYAKGRDELVRDVLYGSTNVLYSQAGGAASARADLIATSVFDVDLIRDGVEQMALNKAPKFGGDAYICYIHPSQAKNLRKDSAWVNAKNYADPQSLLNGEIGRIEDVRFIETTMCHYIPVTTQDIYADGTDTGTNTAVAANSAATIYRAVMVADYAVGLAESLPVEMRDNGIEDFGRMHSLAYYGIWGAGLIEEGHVQILESA